MEAQELDDATVKMMLEASVSGSGDVMFARLSELYDLDVDLIHSYMNKIIDSGINFVETNHLVREEILAAAEEDQLALATRILLNLTATRAFMCGFFLSEGRANEGD